VSCPDPASHHPPVVVGLDTERTRVVIENDDEPDPFGSKDGSSGTTFHTLDAMKFCVQECNANPSLCDINKNANADGGSRKWQCFIPIPLQQVK
jgi:hypothetical protein